MDFALILPAFFAGLITFLAPCTLPLVPVYLSFISGVGQRELSDPATAEQARKKIVTNGLFFTLGFSLIFITFGLIAGLAGVAFAPFRLWLARFGGLFVMFSGLLLLGAVRIPALATARRMAIPSFVQRGTKTGSLFIGGAFALGWTPCVGPILATILFFASTSSTALQGALLLCIFSIGLALPFLAISFTLRSAARHIDRFFSFLRTFRVPILSLFGLAAGLLINVALVATVLFFTRLFGTSIGEPTSLLDATTWLLYKAPYIFPIVTSVCLGLIAYHRHDIDILSTLGGLFLIPLGVLLATNNFGIVIQYSYQVLRFLHFESLLQYL